MDLPAWKSAVQSQEWRVGYLEGELKRARELLDKLRTQKPQPEKKED